MTTSIQNTLGNTDWLRDNEDKLRDLLPPIWTRKDNLNGLQIGYRLKLIGVDWRSQEEFGKVLAFLTKIAMLEVSKDMIHLRRNPRSVFE